MANTLINITLPVVNEIIDDVLAAGQSASYRETFASSDVRDRLATFVLSRLPARYMTISDSEYALEYPRNCYSAEQHRHIRQLVDQGIQKLLARPVTPTPETLFPSTWFG
ncbi:late competence development ComFB family protein [Leptolyngbya sp. Heron Island J]|uniref:late competence development ComFB family protein n=1 Tax=Leptolyngbya sp. Heron Island J TaxID=1385935 RepID=UPI000429AE64|nr:late competence development ComFB family protein [Leptolyngbya sp. Heron Island J]